MARIESNPDLRQRAQRFRQALSHWGVREYTLIAALWLMMSSPAFIHGYGLLSLAFPILIIAAAAVAAPLLVKLATLWSDWRYRPLDTSHLPADILHDTLGTLTLDRRTGWYHALVTWAGKPATLSFPVVDDARLALAVTILQREPLLTEQIERLVVETVFPEIAQDLPYRSRAHLTPRELLDEIELMSILIDDADNFSFACDDHDLAFAHGIAFVGDAERGIFEAEIHG